VHSYCLGSGHISDVAFKGKKKEGKAIPVTGREGP
jgi:hypothetical protein